MRGTVAGVVTLLAVVALSGCLAAAGPGTSPSPAKPFTLAVYGDSFTTAWEPGVGDQMDINWATGTEPGQQSILQRLRREFPDAQASNVAVGGQRVRDLAEQDGKVIPDADVVMVWMGINDLCRGSPAEDLAFREEVRAAFDVLASTHPDGNVVIFSIPDLWRLHEEHLKRPETAKFWSFHKDYCGDFFNPPAHPLAEALAKARLDLLNDALRAEADAHGFTYSEAISWPGLSLEDFSHDYFHPNASGERRIAAAAWPVAGAVARAP